MCESHSDKAPYEKRNFATPAVSLLVFNMGPPRRPPVV